MNVWILTLWITFSAADGGMIVEAKMVMKPGTNRASCEYFGQTTSKDMMLHGIPETDDEGKVTVIYPAKVRGQCELE